MSLEKEEIHMKKKWIGAIAAVAALIAAVVFVVLWFSNKWYIELSILDNEEVFVEYGDSYDDSDVIAFYKGTYFNRKGTEVEVTVEGTVDVTTLGVYEVVYKAEYKGKTASASRRVTVEDQVAPVISLVSAPDHFTSPVGEYEEEGYTAVDNYDGDLTDQVVREERDGKVIYTVSDSFGNVATVTRDIIYKDVVPPVIVLKKGDTLTVEAGTEFSDPGYEASDDCDGDLKDSVTVEGSVDTGTLGTYILTYKVKDSYDNECSVERTVKVVDTTAPELTLGGSEKPFLKKGSDYTEEGCSAKDAFEGDLTGDISISGSVDTNKVGVYILTYTVKDSSGNQGTAKRTVYIYEKQAEVNTVDPGSKVVYLTFDDGPGKYTQELLDVLDKYGVKVTFFVTNQYPDYQNLIAEEYKRGHTVAIHSYSHDYSKIYVSEEAFYEDVQKMGDICYKQTGVYPDILRFPGGSSNAVSKKYCNKIMTDLTNSVEKMGYQYCDWNVASGDAGETTSTSVVVSNVIAGMKRYDVSVVLQHDIKGFSVNAVEEIIAWGLANGYTFLPMDETTPMVHHGLNN